MPATFDAFAPFGSSLTVCFGDGDNRAYGPSAADFSAALSILPSSSGGPPTYSGLGRERSGTMSVLPCIVACVITHGQLETVPSAALVMPAAGGTVRFALRSEWFGPEFTIRPAVPGAGVIRFTDPWDNRGGSNP